MTDPKPSRNRKLVFFLWVGLIDIVALVADGTTITDWLHRTGLL